ncbi:MAG TPA: hypothetical protein VFO94_12815 [Gammaproteobacteria bacterium]|nr:hypothetical protein [Gammaproteobacteria bacterium]
MITGIGPGAGGARHRIPSSVPCAARQTNIEPYQSLNPPRGREPDRRAAIALFHIETLPVSIRNTEIGLVLRQHLGVERCRLRARSDRRSSGESLPTTTAPEKK